LDSTGNKKAKNITNRRFVTEDYLPCDIIGGEITEHANTKLAADNESIFIEFCEQLNDHI